MVYLLGRNPLKPGREKYYKWGALIAWQAMDAGVELFGALRPLLWVLEAFRFSYLNFI